MSAEGGRSGAEAPADEAWARPLLDVLAAHPLTAGPGARHVALAEVDSTSARAAALAREGAPEGSAVVARAQTAGRGRLGRTWASPPGGLYLSLVLRPDEDMLRRLPVTLLAGLAAAEAADDVAPPAAGPGAAAPAAALKWPNDVELEGRKVAGVLADLTREAGRSVLVLGLGVNVEAPLEALPDDVRARATSLAAAHGASPGLARVLDRFLARFEPLYRAVQRGGGAHILASASARMPLLGRPVRVRLPDRVLEGRAAGLGATGALVVEGPDGAHETVVAGEVEEVRAT